MSRLLMHIQNRMPQEDGQALGEFAFIIGLIAVACIVALGLLGSAIGDPYDLLRDGLPGGGGS